MAPLWSLCVAEFIGTYFLVLTVGCNVMDGNPAWAVTSIASVLTVMIYALGGISGGHFNPAVTFAIALSNKIDSWATAGLYIIIQIIAGITAGYTYTSLYSHLQLVNLEPSGYRWYSAMSAEILYTLMLCFTVLNVACTKKNAPNQYAPLAIGFVVVAGGYGAGRVSMGCFNPAVAFGVDFASIWLGFGWSFAYMGFEFLGAVLAACLYRLVRPEEFWQADVSSLWPKLLAEFLGTFYLALTVGFNVLPTNSKAAAWSIAASLMSMVYALGSCSGAHFNPAVTLAILLSGRNKTNTSEAAAYMTVQILGGVAGAFTSTITVGGVFGLGLPDPTIAGYGAVGVAECVFTFVLCFVALNVASTQTASKDMFGFAIGMCVTVGGCAVGSVSGGCLNPAVAIGVGLGSIGILQCCYWVFVELLGGLAAAGLFYAFRPEEFGKGLPLRI